MAGSMTCFVSACHSSQIAMSTVNAVHPSKVRLTLMPHIDEIEATMALRFRILIAPNRGEDDTPASVQNLYLHEHGDIRKQVRGVIHSCSREDLLPHYLHAFQQECVSSDMLTYAVRHVWDTCMLNDQSKTQAVIHGTISIVLTHGRLHCLIQAHCCSIGTLHRSILLCISV